MSFSPAWLALREPADRAARNKDVLKACAAHFATRDTVSICDLGAGTGSSVRALADHLPKQQHWTLVDRDAHNLAEAKRLLSARTITTQQQDFALNPHCWPAGTDLVTASALFDLASHTWIERFVAHLAAHKTPLLSMLTANDSIILVPAHPHDRDVIAAFHRHQTRDKGFGPSAGSQAARILEEALCDAGYTLTVGDSPWELSQGELLEATLDGMAQAVVETGTVSATDIAVWRAQKRQRLSIDHRDAFARFT